MGEELNGLSHKWNFLLVSLNVGSQKAIPEVLVS